MYRGVKIFFGFCLCAGMLGAYVLLEPYWIHINAIAIRDPDIPTSFEGVRIVFVSDIHHGPYFSIQRVRRLVEKIQQLQPDILVFGGDYVHQDAQYIMPCFAELTRVNAPLGKFGVLGNHDHWEGAALTRQRMRKAWIAILDNQAEWIVKDGSRIKIGGVGDLWEDHQNITPTIGDTVEGDFVILISHNPDYAEQVATHNIDLMLSGHTHGGQVTLFGLWAPFIPSRYGQKYRTGVVATAFTRVIITNGVGTITPPVRFFARPEIILLTLKHGV